MLTLAAMTGALYPAAWVLYLACLAGGIWVALLTTAAGMAVAIPAGVALSWFESISDRLQADLEDLATRVFVAAPRARSRPEPQAGEDWQRQAAE